MLQASFNQDGNVHLLSVKHGNLFSNYHTISPNKVTMTRKICQGITLIRTGQKYGATKWPHRKIQNFGFFFFLKFTFKEMNF